MSDFCSAHKEQGKERICLGCTTTLSEGYFCSVCKKRNEKLSKRISRSKGRGRVYNRGDS